MSESIKEVLNFLAVNARLDLKAVAVTNLLGLTGTEAGVNVLVEMSDSLVALHSLLSDSSESIAKDAALSVVNVSAYEKGAVTLLNLTSINIVATALQFILNQNSHISDACCMVLSNLSRNSCQVERIVDLLERSPVSFDSLVDAFTKTSYNTKGANLHYLGPVFSNLSQSSRVRRYILDKKKCIIQRLITFTEYKDSIVRRGGVVGTLRNCCFEIDHHSWLLSDEVDILPRLLLPLADNTEYDEEDNDKLPLELQYLPPEKEREMDPDVRCMLLESLIQLCALRENRRQIRGSNAYVILRELHKWETNRKALLTCENLVDLLIRTEDEIGKDNLKEVEVPDHLCEKFVKMNSEFLNQS